MNEADKALRARIVELVSAVYDGIARAGVRLVTMAGVLKGKAFPLAEVTGFLFDPGDADDIARAIHQCRLLSVEERVWMGQKGRQYAQSELSLDNCARRYEELLARLAE